MLLRPKKESRGPLGAFFRWFNKVFGRATDGYVGVCRHLIRKAGFAFLLLGILCVGAGFFGKKIPGSFLPDEDQGYVFGGFSYPMPPRCSGPPRPPARSKRSCWTRPACERQHRRGLQPA